MAVATYLVFLRFIVYRRDANERDSDVPDERDYEMVWQWGLGIGIVMLPCP